MATLADNLSGLNQGKRYQRTGWPADRWLSLKNPGAIEVLTAADLQGTWSPSGTPVTKDLSLIWWLVPGDFHADDYQEESA